MPTACRARSRGRERADDERLAIVRSGSGSKPAKCGTRAGLEVDDHRRAARREALAGIVDRRKARSVEARLEVDEIGAAGEAVGAVPGRRVGGDLLERDDG